MASYSYLYSFQVLGFEFMVGFGDIGILVGVYRDWCFKV
jgi:hypothetical protein